MNKALLVALTFAIVIALAGLSMLISSRQTTTVAAPPRPQLMAGQAPRAAAPEEAADVPVNPASAVPTELDAAAVEL